MPAETSDNRFSTRLTLLVCLMMCGVMSRLPMAWEVTLRQTLLDVVSPVSTLRQEVNILWGQRSSDLEQRYAALKKQHDRERASWEHRLRRRELQLAKLRAQPSISEFGAATSDRLFSMQLIRSEILSSPQIGYLRRQLLISNDGKHSLEADQFVLQDSQADEESGVPSPIIDRGAASHVEEGQPVIAGQCVVGVVEEIGQLVGRIRLVTDVQYRGRACILRRVEDGYAYGPEGVLEGDGSDLCLLRYVSKTESVRVGDDVYTRDPTTSTSAPMYYGKIVEASLDPHAHEWTIRVKPGFDPQHLSRVQILNYQVPSLQPMGN